MTHDEQMQRLSALGWTPRPKKLYPHYYEDWIWCGPNNKEIDTGVSWLEDTPIPNELLALLEPKQTRDQRKPVECTVCGRTKKPWGRGAPMGSNFCQHGCEGYGKTPLPGNLWPGETDNADLEEAKSKQAHTPEPLDEPEEAWMGTHDPAAHMAEQSHRIAELEAECSTRMTTIRNVIGREEAQKEHIAEQDAKIERILEYLAAVERGGQGKDVHIAKQDAKIERLEKELAEYQQHINELEQERDELYIACKLASETLEFGKLDMKNISKKFIADVLLASKTAVENVRDGLITPEHKVNRSPERLYRGNCDPYIDSAKT